MKGLTRILQCLVGGFSKFYHDATKILTLPPPSPKVNDDHVWNQGNYEKIMKSINKGYNNRLEGAVYLSNGKLLSLE